MSSWRQGDTDAEVYGTGVGVGVGVGVGGLDTPRPMWYLVNMPMYKCKCGFESSNHEEYKKHMMKARWEPGQHGTVGGPVHQQGERAKASETKAAPRVDPKAKAVRTDAVADAVRIRVIPREFILDVGNIFWRAMQVAINEWHWPQDISPQDFLDTYLYVTLKHFDIILDGYERAEEHEEEKHETEVTAHGS